MQAIMHVPALLSITACNRRHITKDITIIVRRASVADAERRASAKLQEMEKRSGRCAFFRHTCGLSYVGKEYSAAEPGKVREVRYHERFHAMVTQAGLDTDDGRVAEIEESAANACEITRMLGKGAQSAYAEHRIYTACSEHSVRLLFSLDHPGMEDMLLAAVGGLVRNGSRAEGGGEAAVDGSSFAVAMGYAPYYLFYRECMAVLRRWGLKDGEKILMDAVAEDGENGPDAARRFVLGKLDYSVRDRINDSYGVDLRGYRFRSLFSPGLETGVWYW
ncbi:MAG: hypothetical protein PHV13_01925 [Candidatus ainarchaeum sp.]|nr:hypothetical protein [Candidatus ainarchaeum sp.]